MELLGDRQRTVAAHANQSAQVELLVSCLDAGEEYRIDFQTILHADGGRESSLVRRTEDRPALRENPCGVFAVQRDVSDRINESFVTFDEAHDIVSVSLGRLDRAADDGVQARAIAARRQDPNAFRRVRHFTYLDLPVARWLRLVLKV